MRRETGFLMKHVCIAMHSNSDRRLLFSWTDRRCQVLAPARVTFFFSDFQIIIFSSTNGRFILNRHAFS